MMMMRVSYSGNTSAFQADARSSILLTRSKFLLMHYVYILLSIIDKTVAFGDRF